MERSEFHIDESASALVRDGATVFVRQELYESIEAPKFQYDFWASENDPIDTDSFFLKAAGVTKASRKFEGTCLEPNLIQVKQGVLVSKASHKGGNQSSATALIQEENSPLERASVSGSKKSRPAVARSLDKVLVNSKTSKAARVPCNAPIPPQASEPTSHNRLQRSSAAEVHRPSENEDPNPPFRAQRKRTIVAGSKSKTASSVSHFAFAASQSLFESKATSESVVDVQCLGTGTEDGVEVADLSVKKTVGTKASQHDSSGAKDRKRKPSGRSADSLAPKIPEPCLPLQSRVSRVPRKVAVCTESCPETKEVVTFSSQPASQQKASEGNGASSKPVKALQNKASAARRGRRISDQNRRRKSSIGTKFSRPRPKIVATVSKSSSREATVLVPRITPSKSSRPQGSKKNKTIQDVGIVGSLPKVVSLACGNEESVGTVNPTQDTTSCDQTIQESTEAGKPLAEVEDCDVQCEDQGVSSKRRRSVLVHSEASSTSSGSSRSADEVLLEQLQNLNLEQGSVSGSGDNKEVQIPRSEVDESDAQLRGHEVLQINEEECERANELEQQENQLSAKPDYKLDICEEKFIDSSHTDTVQIPQDCHFGYRLTVEVKDFGSRVGGATVLHTCETNSAGSKLHTELGGTPHASEKWNVEETGASELRDNPVRSCDVCTLDESKDSPSGSKVLDNEDQASLLSEFQNLRLPRGDDSHPSEEPQPDRMQVLEVKTKFLLYSQREASELTVEASLSSASGSDGGFESKTSSTKKFLSGDATFPNKERKSCTIGGEAQVTKGAHLPLPILPNQNKKRKSIEIAAQKGDLRVPVGSSIAAEPLPVKTVLESVALSSSSLQSCTARSGAFSASSQFKKMKATCPQPFRLRTQERGAQKEVELKKKVEQNLVAKDKVQVVQAMTNRKLQGSCTSGKEKPHFVAPTANKETKGAVKPLNTLKDPRSFAKPGHLSKIRAAAVQHAEAEVKKMRKNMVPHSQKMPAFDKPFIPHRSTKTPTIPNSPNFQSKAKMSSTATKTQA